MNHLINIRHILYDLKIGYGVTLDLYRTVVGATNLTSGAKNLTRTKYKIKRVIWLPIKFQTLPFYTSAFTKAAHEFQYGGYQDQEFKTAVIDGRDLPAGFEVLPEDYLIQNHKKYEIKTIENFEGGYSLIVQRLTGAPVNEVHEATVYQSIRFLQDSEEELNA